MEKWARAKYQSGLPLGKDGTRMTAGAEHLRLTREAAAEGMVLLKNEKRGLPLQSGSKIALFGKATFDYVQGGGGSGEVNVAYSRNLYEGLLQKADRICVFEPLADFYRRDVQEQLSQGAVAGMTVEPEIPEALLRVAVEFADTAIISICRFSGEGWDRKSIVNAETENLWDNIDTPALLSAKLFEDGDFCLTRSEKAMVQTVTSLFEKVVVVINAGGVMDTDWFCDNDKIQAALMIWAGGMEGGLAAADILAGDVNPSGKLADTFAKRLEDYPSTKTFHTSDAYVEYQEDIYVGYRYFETLPSAKNCVNYPFGFGLSYTTFSVEVCSYSADEDNITVGVAVINTGGCAGKEVVQLYFSAPQGALGKPARQLIAFAKTDLLAPKQTQRLQLHVSAADMASFDDLGKVRKSAYVLEEGFYHFYLGTDVRKAALLPNAYCCKTTRTVLQLAPKLTPTQLTGRMLADGSYENLPLYIPEDVPVSFLTPLLPIEMDGYAPAVQAKAQRLCMRQYQENAITLCDVANGKEDIERFLDQLTDEEMANLLGGQPNTGLGITFGMGNLPEYGIPNIMTADGPAGLRVAPETGIHTTAWPCATLLACTWNEALVSRVGVAGAQEVKENNIGMWLTPAINIHRSPLCGRNFEYYSEDPLLTGKLAGAMVRGIQSQNIAACVKHFAFNNKETNRKHSDSRVSERAAREIYLRAFEIVVKESEPWMLMSSYNLVNGFRCAESHALLEDILRGEWRFRGLVTTDWWAHSEEYLEIEAGNDIKMGCGYPTRILEALCAGKLSREKIRRSVRRLLELIIKID